MLECKKTYLLGKTIPLNIDVDIKPSDISNIIWKNENNEIIYQGIDINASVNIDKIGDYYYLALIKKQ